MVHDVAVLGATVAGLTLARRLASEGYDVVVLDPGGPATSAGVGHGVAVVGHARTVARLAAAYGEQAAVEYVRRNLVALDEIRRVTAAGDVTAQSLPVHDHSQGVALDRELEPVRARLLEAGAEVRVLRRDERALTTPGLLLESAAVPPAAYARALQSQAITAGTQVLHDVTVTHLTRRQGTTRVWYRPNLAWVRDLEFLSAQAVVDTLGVSPWGTGAAVSSVQTVPVVRFTPPEPLTRVTLLAGPPVAMVCPWGEEGVALGPVSSPGLAPRAQRDLSGWVERQLGAREATSSVMEVDPSDHGRPVVGASAIPGGFYARGNGRNELVHGTASACYLAGVLAGLDAPARSVALPLATRVRARALGRRRRR